MFKFMGVGGGGKKTQVASNIPGYLLRDQPEEDGFIMVGDQHPKECGLQPSGYLGVTVTTPLQNPHTTGTPLQNPQPHTQPDMTGYSSYSDSWKSIPFQLSRKYFPESAVMLPVERIKPVDLTPYQYDFSLEHAVLAHT